MPIQKEFVDVLVVGSGASGGPVAFELARSGAKVMVLEKGDWCPRDTEVEDELSQLHREIYRPSGDMDPTVIKSQGKTVAETSRLGQAFYLVGGGSVRYSGTSWRMREDDFRKFSKYGAVEGASLADWPITYEELEPYYTKAEEEIGISGLAGDDPTEPYRSRNVLMPPLASDNWQDRLSKAARTLGWKPFHIPIAIHSQPNSKTGGAACMQCGWCSGFPCMFHAKSSVDITIYPRAQDTGNFTLRTKAYATRITTGDDGRANGVEYINTETGETEFVGCKILVLAASAIQTTRLMMLSTSNRFPKGLANENDLLGRNLMFHIECKASAAFNDVFNQHLYKKIGVHDFYYPKKTDNFINHRSLQSGSKSSPIAFGLSREGYGASLEKDIRENFLRTQEVQCMVEDLPQMGNRVLLSETKKDPWGIPAPEVHHAYHEMDKRAAGAANDRIRELMVAAGGEDIRIPDVHDNVSGRYSWHLMGTARMGNDPATSILNSDCRAHSVNNLYIVDGSSFTTSVGLNPTLTMQALAFRTADKIKLALKGNG